MRLEIAPRALSGLVLARSLSSSQWAGPNEFESQFLPACTAMHTSNQFVALHTLPRTGDGAGCARTRDITAACSYIRTHYTCGNRFEVPPPGLQVIKPRAHPSVGRPRMHVVDEFTRESLADLVAYSIDADATVTTLGKVAAWPRLPGVHPLRQRPQADRDLRCGTVPATSSQAPRGRTRGWSPTAVACATNCSPSSSSTPCWKPSCLSPTGEGSTTPTVLTRRSACSRPPNLSPNGCKPANRSSHSGWTDQRGPVREATRPEQGNDHADDEDPTHVPFLRLISQGPQVREQPFCKRRAKPVPTCPTTRGRHEVGTYSARLVPNRALQSTKPLLARVRAGQRLACGLVDRV